MVLRGGGAWAVSAGLHAALIAVGGMLLFQAPPSDRPVLRMRIVSSSGTSPVSARGALAAVSPPESPDLTAPDAPHLPAWHDVPALSAVEPSFSVPVVLDELLAATADSPAPTPGEVTAPTAAGTGGSWAGPEGLGYAPPPLPPPALSPPQGAQWSLVLTIPAGGGFARSVEGLDSGNPDLDRWLEEYLRTVSFPASPDGQDYDVRWNLRLGSERPR